MAAPSDPSPRRILYPSPDQLRVLAHPLRSRLLGSLRLDGPATATSLAARLGTNSGATSYHLRQLAAAGIVEDDPERSTGRERVWRASHDGTSWRSPDYDADPDAQAADDWLVRHHAAVMAGWVDSWLEGRAGWSRSWRWAADQSDYHLHVTPEQLASLVAELHAVVDRYRDREDPDAPGAERVSVLLQAFPSPDLVP
jgi:DNA-binding transcriptional ArsR family regulator